MLTPELHLDLTASASRRRPHGDQRGATILQLLTAADSVRDLLRRSLAEHGCTELGFVVLTTLRAADGGPLPPSVLAERTGIFRGTLTDVLSRLEACGLVARRRNATDRRQLLAVLTPRGRQKCERIIKNHVDTILEIAAAFPAQSLSALAALGQAATSVSQSFIASHER